MNVQARQNAYELVTSLASLDEASGLDKDRAVLLLWFLRGAVGLEELDAYDYICDGDDDNGVDALFLEERQGDDDVETLVIYQSQFTEAPRDLGPTKLERLLAAANHFKTTGALGALLAGRLEPALRRLTHKFGLPAKLARGEIEAGRLRIRLVLVTTGVLLPETSRAVDAANSAEGEGYLTVYDLSRLARLAEVIAVPESEVEKIVLSAPPDNRLIVETHENGNRVAVVPVRASELVAWEGLEERKLFELNVRGELKRNRVRDQLDAAIRRQGDHRDFLASHNGMTIVCERFDDTDPDHVIAFRPSIVNGAQSATAFLRGAGDGVLTDELQVFVKLVEVQGRPQFASSVSARSNTQNAVNPRNLVANTGPQRRLAAEFVDRFPGVYYEIKPDATRRAEAAAEGKRIVANDEAAQLLCTVFVQEPWLAVKRTSLFEADDHPRIFSQGIHAEHVMLCLELADAVDGHRERVPERYRRSWKLTKLVLVYLVGQVLRSDPELADVIDRPAEALGDLDGLRERIRRPLGAAVLTLRKRVDRRDRDEEEDDFRVDFKNRDELRELRNQARETYLTLVEAADLNL